MAWTLRDARLFRGTRQVENFRQMATLTPCRRINRSDQPRPFANSSESFELPESFESMGRHHGLIEFLERVTTTGLMVIRGGELLYENYWEGNRADTQAALFSCTKSFTSTLVACALRDGYIASLDDPADRYAPELKGSGYEGVRIEDILQMSSGVRWNEDYGDPNSDVARFGAAYREPRSFDEVCASLPREYEPGTYNRYNSCDTHVLAMILERATGTSWAEYLHSEIWQKLGMEDDGFILVDGRGMAAGAMGLQVTLRDMAKLGLLMLRKGVTPGGEQILPPGWYEACTTATKPHLLPGHRTSANYPWGYSYQWWLPDLSGAFTALGVYHQMIWVDPRHEVVIAKTTAYPRYGQVHSEEERVDIKHFAMCHAISAAAAGRNCS